MTNGAIACFTQRIISLHISIDKNDFCHLSLNISNVNIYSVGNVPVVEVDCVVKRIVKIVESVLGESKEEPIDTIVESELIKSPYSQFEHIFIGCVLPSKLYCYYITDHQ